MKFLYIIFIFIVLQDGLITKGLVINPFTFVPRSFLDYSGKCSKIVR